MERTLILVKPDAMQRGLAFEILGRLQQRGLKIVGLKLMQVTQELAGRHYAEHAGKGFYPGLVSFITSRPIIAAVFEGPNVVAAARQTMGKTNPLQAEAGTIRGDFGIDTGRNLVHGSDGPESAEREINLFFKPEEIAGYEQEVDRWIVE
jgi:nucleoside-diphosphate kinase